MAEVIAIIYTLIQKIGIDLGVVSAGVSETVADKGIEKLRKSFFSSLISCLIKILFI